MKPSTRGRLPVAASLLLAALEALAFVALLFILAAVFSPVARSAPSLSERQSILRGLPSQKAGQ